MMQWAKHIGGAAHVCHQFGILAPRMTLRGQEHRRGWAQPWKDSGFTGDLQGILNYLPLPSMKCRPLRSSIPSGM
jgi:hypothetical protein